MGLRACNSTDVGHRHYTPQMLVWRSCVQRTLEDIKYLLYLSCTNTRTELCSAYPFNTRRIFVCTHHHHRTIVHTTDAHVCIAVCTFQFHFGLWHTSIWCLSNCLSLSVSNILASIGGYAWVWFHFVSIFVRMRVFAVRHHTAKLQINYL